MEPICTNTVRSYRKKDVRAFSQIESWENVSAVNPTETVNNQTFVKKI